MLEVSDLSVSGIKSLCCAGAVTLRGAGSELRHFQMLKSEAVDTGFNRQRPQNSVNTTWRDTPKRCQTKGIFILCDSASWRSSDLTQSRKVAKSQSRRDAEGRPCFSTHVRELPLASTKNVRTIGFRFRCRGSQSHFHPALSRPLSIQMPDERASSK